MTSCFGDSNGSSSPTSSTHEASADPSNEGQYLANLDPSWRWSTSFNTRLSTELLISGRRCKEADSETCPRGLWLVIIDNLNRCSPEGQYTEIAVDPVATELRKSNQVFPSTLAFYDMIPLGPLSSEQSQLMSKHWVRFNLNGNPIVLEK